MKTNTLKGHDFLLGLEEDWDSYIEVTVNFIHDVNVDLYTYYLFKDKKNNNYFYINPRYSGHQIEEVFIEKGVIVNIFKQATDMQQKEEKQPEFYATGILKLI